ncbi:hypothetical protein, partial [Enterobacter roggenkampii]|uniref:hypothetical protein n=1 Tax=Enterobacter roggenkampii TaxID=1812935 RepID=UPI001955396B
SEHKTLSVSWSHYPFPQMKNASGSPPAANRGDISSATTSVDVLLALHTFLLTAIYLAYRTIDKIYY